MDGVVIDYAKDKRIVAIEVLDASKRTTRKPLDLTNLAIVNLPDPMLSEKVRRNMAKRHELKANVAAHDSKEKNGLNDLNGLNVSNRCFLCLVTLNP